MSASWDPENNVRKPIFKTLGIGLKAVIDRSFTGMYQMKPIPGSNFNT